VPIIHLERTRRTPNAIQRFANLIKSILYITNVYEVILDVAVNDSDAIDLCGRMDLRWHLVRLRYLRDNIQPFVEFYPHLIFSVALCKPTVIPMRSAAIDARCRWMETTRARCDHDDLIDVALALASTVDCAHDSFVLPIYVIIEIIDWLPEMAIQNAYLKLTWLQKLEASIRRCAEQRQQRNAAMKNARSL
jgi:hypothetical protein